MQESHTNGPGRLAWPDMTVLVVDDEPGMRSFLLRALQHRCAQVDVAGDIDSAERLVERQRFDLIILDITLPGRSGVSWLSELRSRGFPGDVILITAFADLDTAIDALRAGASDFLLKPFRLPQMLNAIQRCAERARLERQNYVLRREVDHRAGVIEGLIGDSAQMRDVCALIKRAAPMPSTVLLQGESGTGKEVAARALHRMSPRSAEPFVPINCAAIGAELIESELFGHIKGAFTGAQTARDGLFYYANGGTLFLDEVADLPLPLQAKLLRVLEERRIRPVGSEQEIPVDVRIVSATNRRLADEVAAGRFRQDLFYRLQVVEILMPPLRERLEDVPALAEHFNQTLASQLGIAALDLPAEEYAQLQRYDWPGNLRELRNLMERSLILGELRVEMLRSPRLLPPESETVAAEQTLDDIEKRHILRVLDAVGGNKTEAARRLGVSRKTLDRRCAVWGM